MSIINTNNNRKVQGLSMRRKSPKLKDIRIFGGHELNLKKTKQLNPDYKNQKIAS